MCVLMELASSNFHVWKSRNNASRSFSNYKVMADFIQVKFGLKKTNAIAKNLKFENKYLIKMFFFFFSFNWR
jgi:hypothetical protein